MTRTNVAGALLCTLALLMHQPGPAQARPSRAERGLIRTINLLRASERLPRLRPDARLHRAAMRHTRDMVRRRFFAHDSSRGTSAGVRLFRIRRWSRVGETLAFTDLAMGSTPLAVVTSWIYSPAHQAILNTPGYRRIGVSARRGRFHGERVVFWTADFATRR